MDVEEIFDPLVMNGTRQPISPNDSIRFAKGYGPHGMPKSHWDLKDFAGAGAIRSTTSDLLKYGEANMDGNSTELSKVMQLTQRETFKQVGLPWQIIRAGPHKLTFHAGLTAGFSSYLIINHEKRLAVVILSNKAIGVNSQASKILI
jgi:CubicO group peptidase (beta-lactamase class C family)